MATITGFDALRGLVWDMGFWIPSCMARRLGLNACILDMRLSSEQEILQSYLYCQ
jgi:hypothetical protein